MIFGGLEIKNRIKSKVSKHTENLNDFFGDIHHHIYHNLEFIVIAFVTVFGIIFAGATSLPNNTSLVYPLQRVSTLECRTIAWEDMDPNCKINLPIIENANYQKYEEKKIYRDIYTTLWGASYNDSRNQYSGAHAGVDIATARGTPLYSIGEGKVYQAGRQNGYGNVVKIEYIVDGEHVFAIYAHMDTIDVKKGEIVKKGEKIGTVGNSGNTFGALGGYHVHLEITKDNSGRPMYSYLGCEDLKKGHYQIIMSGLCRTELAKGTYDPIAYIEKHKETYKPIDWTISNDKNTKDIIDKGEDDIVVWKGIVAINDGLDTDLNLGNNVDNVKVNDNKLTVINTDNIVTKENNLIELDFSKVSEGLKHFISQRNIEISTDGGNADKSIGVGDKLFLDIKVSNKKDGTTFVGLLKYALGFISTNKNIETDSVNIQLIKSSGTKLIIEGKKVGKSTLIINLGGEKIGKLNIEVK